MTDTRTLRDQIAAQLNDPDNINNRDPFWNGWNGAIKTALAILDAQPEQPEHYTCMTCGFDYDPVKRCRCDIEQPSAEPVAQTPLQRKEGNGQ